LPSRDENDRHGLGDRWLRRRLSSGRRRRLRRRWLGYRWRRSRRWRFLLRWRNRSRSRCLRLSSTTPTPSFPLLSLQLLRQHSPRPISPLTILACPPPSAGFAFCTAHQALHSLARPFAIVLSGGFLWFAVLVADAAAGLDFDDFADYVGGDGDARLVGGLDGEGAEVGGGMVAARRVFFDPAG
jgi:hypothetical protein